jgi:epidermal growth factor receptor substrate 15
MCFTPTPSELSLTAQIFAKADPDKLRILSRDAAFNVFGGAKLHPTILDIIWSIADEENIGWLPQEKVAIAVRLLGKAQKGMNVTKASIIEGQCHASLWDSFIIYEIQLSWAPAYN